MCSVPNVYHLPLQKESENVRINALEMTGHRIHKLIQCEGNMRTDEASRRLDPRWALVVAQFRALVHEVARPCGFFGQIMSQILGTSFCEPW